MATKYLKPRKIHCHYHLNDPLHFPGTVLSDVFARVYGVCCISKVCDKQGDEKTLGERKLATDEMAHCFLPLLEQGNRLSGTYLCLNKARWHQDPIYRLPNSFVSIYPTAICDHG